MAERVLLALCEEFLSKQVEVRLLNEGKKWSKIWAEEEEEEEARLKESEI